MSQLPFESGFYYHLFNRGNNRENIFKEPQNYLYFLNLVKKYLVDICDIYAYSLLPNHFHFLIRIRDIDFLPEEYIHGTRKIHQPFSNLFNAYSKAINKKYSRTGSLFQKQLHRIKVENEDYFRELILYIHFNAEKHEIDSDYTTYPYSSYKAYVKNMPTQINIAETVGCFGGLENFKFCHKSRKLNLNILKEIEEMDY